MSKKLSEHFTLDELTYSDTAKKYKISNFPTPTHESNLVHTCQYLLEPLRKLLNEKYKEYKGKKVRGVSIRITSGYRSAALNTKVGGSKTSEHCSGCAADIEAKLLFQDGTSRVLPYTELYADVKAFVKGGKLTVDQCIQEYSNGVKWVHVSLKPQLRDCRKQFLIYDGKTYREDRK